MKKARDFSRAFAFVWMDPGSAAHHCVLRRVRDDAYGVDQKSIPPPSKSAVADFELIKPGGFLNGLP